LNPTATRPRLAPRQAIGRWRRGGGGAPSLLAFDARAARLLGGSVLCGVLAAGCTVGLALLASAAISNVFLGGAQLDDVAPLLAGAILAVLARAASLSAQEVLAQRASTRLRSALRDRLVRRIGELGPTWLAGERTGEIAGTVTGGLEDVDAWVTSYQPARWLAVLVPAMVLGVMLVLDVPTALVLVLTGPVLVLLLVVIGGRTQAITQRRLGELRWLSAFFLDMLRGIATLKAFGRSREQADNLRTISDRYGRTTMDVLQTAFQTALVLEWATAVATAVVAVEVSLRLMDGAVPFQTAIAVLIITPEFFAPLRQLAVRYHAGAAGRAAAAGMQGILEAPPPRLTQRATQGMATMERTPDDASAADGATHAPAPAGSASIRFDDVWYAYPGRPPALRGLNLEIPAGGVVALVGPTGAGKTTVGSMLLRFIEPGRGSIHVGETRLADVDPRAWLANVAWVPQRPHLTYGSVAEAIRLARPDASDDDVVAAAQAANADEFIRLLPAGYDTNLGPGGGRLSGGQQQRLAIARAFLRDASLVVLDEPTSHLDAASEAAIGEAIQRLRRDRTVVLISHRLRLAELADRVAVLESGVVVDQGPPAGVVERTGVDASPVLVADGRA
jgi:ATP-binding cassette, subfamily C, bacterial CydD